MKQIRFLNRHNELKKRRLLRKNQTDQENKVWNIIRNRKMGVKFKRQVSIGVYVADFYCAEKKLVIEIDGSQHVAGKDYDMLREKFFLTLKIKTMRFWNYEINQSIDGVYMKIKQEIES